MGPSSFPVVSRRDTLAASTVLLGSLAGCTSIFDDSSSATPDAPSAEGPATTDGRTETTTPSLHVQSGSDLHSVLHEAAIAWNLNPKLSDRGWVAELDTDSDGRVADYFCQREGLNPTGKRSNPPVQIVISHSDPPSVARDLAAERVDLGDTRYEKPASLSESLTRADRFVGHQVATAGGAFIVSPSIIDEGVTALRAADVRDIYAGEITNWRAVGGPDREITVIAGPDANPPRWFMESFFDGAPETGVDVRFGRVATRISEIESRNDAIGEVPLGVADSDSPVLDLRVDGTRYSVSETGYPSTVSLACYTWGEPDPRERAFISYLQSPAGQRYVDRNRDFLPLDREVD